jgi:hypothetical protein
MISQFGSGETSLLLRSLMSVVVESTLSTNFEYFPSPVWEKGPQLASV